MRARRLRDRSNDAHSRRGLTRSGSRARSSRCPRPGSRCSFRFGVEADCRDRCVVEGPQCRRSPGRRRSQRHSSSSPELKGGQIRRHPLRDATAVDPDSGWAGNGLVPPVDTKVPPGLHRGRASRPAGGRRGERFGERCRRDADPGGAVAGVLDRSEHGEVDQPVASSAARIPARTSTATEGPTRTVSSGSRLSVEMALDESNRVRSLCRCRSIASIRIHARRGSVSPEVGTPTSSRTREPKRSNLRSCSAAITRRSSAPASESVSRPAASGRENGGVGAGVGVDDATAGPAPIAGSLPSAICRVSTPKMTIAAATLSSAVRTNAILREIRGSGAL